MVDRSQHSCHQIPEGLPKLPVRVRESSKFDYGRVVLVVGSRGMAGAAALSSMAALRAGAGLVEAVVPESIQATVAGFDPCIMTHALPEDAAGRFSLSALSAIQARCQKADVVALGPGLGRSDDLLKIVHDLWQTLPMPVVLMRMRCGHFRRMRSGGKSNMLGRGFLLLILVSLHAFSVTFRHATKCRNATN